MEGHVSHLQMALATHLAGAKLLDGNFDGKLDENDLVFTKGAGERVNVQRIGEVLRDRVRIGGAMIRASREMARAKHEFKSKKDHKFNTDLWQPVSPGSPTFTIKPGVKPSEAMRDMFDNPRKYGFECATAVMVVHHKAILDLIGPKDFNAAFSDLRIGPGPSWNLFLHRASDGSKTEEASAQRKAELKAGDYTFIANWDVSADGKAGGYNGLNTIYLGDGKFYAHPYGITTEQAIVKYLNEHRKPGSRRSASMVGHQARIRSSIPSLDETSED